MMPDRTQQVDETTRLLNEALRSAKLDPGAACVVALDLLHNVFTAVACLDCRRQMSSEVGRLFAEMVADALEAPHERTHLH
jgi:hypothetical protein